MNFIRVGELPAVRLQARDGAQATICLFGAHVVSWIPAGGVEQIFCSEKSALDGSKAIRGGIPVIFPQFAEQGSGMRHGFARMSNWRLADSGTDREASFANFVLSSEDQLAAGWPHAFQIGLHVAVQAGDLELRFNARNIGDEPFSFSTALHSYLLVEDIASVEIDGLRHGEFQDQLHPEKRRGIQNEALLKCGDKLDRIYHRVPADLTVRSAGRRLCLHQAGFSDAVVWNPGAEAAAALSDLGDHEYRQFICVEAAQIERIHLPPGQEWVGYHRMRA